MSIFLGKKKIDFLGGTKNFTGGFLLQEKTVTPTASIQAVLPDFGYDGLSKVTVNAATLTPTLQEKVIIPNEFQQLIEADEGYDGLKNVRILAISGTYIGSEITKKEASTIIPGSADQTIAAGTYLSGAQTIKAVATETKSITTNGTYTPTTGKYFSSITVNVPTSSGTVAPTLQTKTINPTESQQQITADEGYDGLEKITINAISNTYIGSGVTKQVAKTITPNSSEQTAVAASVYTTGVIKVSAVPEETKSITANGTYTPTSGKWFSSVTVNVPAQSISTQTKTATPTESEQTITPDTGKYLSSVTVGAISSTYIGSGIARKSSTDLTVSGATVTVPAGYYSTQATKSVTTGSIAVNTPSINTSTGVITASTTLTTAGYVSSNPSSKTLNLTTQAAKEITPSSSSQTAVAKNVYTTGAVTVAAVPTETKTVTENGTYTPTSGKWFNSVTVNIPVKTYYTGSSDPSSSLGNDGDIYLKI